jgi:methyltransferase (TIGR00027 family)
MRGLGAFLPTDARLSDDPFGLRFAAPLAFRASPASTASIARVQSAARRFPRVTERVVARDAVLSMQIRTRVLDDVMLGFLAQGGRQVLLLGAGFDCRAARFRHPLADATVFEVDHPATQARKRSVLAGAGVRTGRVAYLPWDFENTSMAELPARLAPLGHDRLSPTLTVWEGVSMYLTAPAVEAVVAAVRNLSAPGSPFALTYLDRAAIERPPLRLRVVRAVVARLGEPFRWGWDPIELPAWLGSRGFTLVSDRTDAGLARELLPPRFAATYHGGLRHIAVAERTGER